MIDKVVESEEKQMDMDVSTITAFPEDDDLLMLEDAKEDAFQYDDNPTQANMTDFKIPHNQENILDSEKPLDDKISVTLQVDRAVTCEQHKDNCKEETSQTSDEVEWDDTILEEQTQAEPNRKVTLHAHLARFETQTQAAQPKQRQMSKEEEVAAMLWKDNRVNTNQEKAQHQQAACKKLLLEKQARSKQPSNLDQSSTDSDTELVAESIATIHQSNARLGISPCMGGNSTNNPQTLQQATEGVSLPVFHNTLPRKYLYWYDLKLQVPASEDAVATLLQVTKAFWAQILSTDDKAALVPWTEEHQHELPLLTSLEKFPSTLGNLRKYFSWAQPNIRGQTLYVSILLGHNMPFLDIMENVWWWLSEKKFGLWK